MKILRNVHVGQTPPRWYGYAYTRYELTDKVDVYAPWGVNLAIALWRWIEFKLNAGVRVERLALAFAAGRVQEHAHMLEVLGMTEDEYQRKSYLRVVETLNGIRSWPDAFTRIEGMTP